MKENIAIRPDAQAQGNRWAEVTQMTSLQTYLDSKRKIAEGATRNEILRPVPGCEGYYATWCGDILSCISRWGGWRKLTPFPDTHGYLKLKIKREAKLKKTAVHRMVALAFHGIPLPGHEVRHLNGNQTDNHASNLRWGTRSENAIDRKLHGTERSAANGRRSAKRGRGVGVYFDSRRGKFYSSIGMNGKQKFLGYFSNAVDARAAYLSAALSSIQKLAEGK